MADFYAILNHSSSTLLHLVQADINYEETVSTLRYADRAKSIVTKAIVNEDPTAKLIRELTEEVTRLRTLLNERGGSAITSLSAPIGTPVAADNAEVDLREQLQTAERLMAGLQETWEQKMQHSHEASVQRERALEDLGIMVHTQSGVVGLSSPRRTPHLVNLNEDPLMSECLLYPLRPGLTHVGKDATLIGIGNHIHLTGAAILPVHCHFDNVDGTVEVVPTSDEAMVVVNGQRITERRKLASGFRVLLGDHHIFRFNNPEEARRDREKMRTRRGVLDVVNADDSELFDDMESTVSSVNVDHDAAYQLRKEVALINDVFDSFAPDYILSSTPRADIDLNSMFTAVEKVNSMQQEESIKTEVIEEKIPSSILPSLPSTLPPVPIDSADDNAPQRRSNLALQDDIARKAITKWRTYRCTSLVEQILESTPLLKEANIIARELGKQINFHLCVMDALRMAAFMTRAFWDRPLTVGADDFSGNASCAMMSSKGGARGAQISIGIEVRRVDVDEEALVALWTLDEFKQRLVEMRSFYYRAGSEQAPGEASTTADLFGDTIPTNAFQHMGTAEVDMRNVAAGRQLQARAAVLSQHDGSVKGWLEVAIHPAGSLASATSSQLLEISIPQMEQVPTGCTRLHVQFRLSETSLSSSIDDRLYSSEPVEVVNKVATVAFQRTVRLSSAASILRIDVFGMGASTSHADVLPAVNEMTESFMRKFTPNTPESCTSQRSPMTQPPCLLPDKHDIYSALQICELSESGYYEPVPVFADSSFADVDPGVFSLRQGVQRRVSVALWHNSGEALPVRAITQMRVSRIRKCTRVGSELVYTGPEPNANDLTLRLSPAGHKLVVKTVDGRTFLGAEASWDSSLHESPLLDRVTISSGQSRPQTRVVATVSWYVDIEGFAEPLPFEMDVFLQVIPRGVKHAPDEVGGLFSGLFSSRALKQLGRVAAVFEVVETPNRVATPPYVGEEHVDTVRLRQCTVVRRQECLDHAASYVRGEEILNGWEPAGPWILFERQVLREKRDRAMEVERRRRMLASVGDMPRPAALGDNQDLLRRCLQLWRRPSIMGRGSQRPPISPVLTSLPPPPLMKTATARIVPKCPVVTHRGYLTLPERPGLTDDWVRRWFVIRRPYLYIYADRSEARELAVIGLSNVRTQWDLRVLEATTNVCCVCVGRGIIPDVSVFHTIYISQQRRNLFCVYTRRQAFVFQAESERDMFKWLAHLDPLQMSAAASNGRVLLM